MSLAKSIYIHTYTHTHLHARIIPADATGIYICLYCVFNSLFIGCEDDYEDNPSFLKKTLESLKIVDGQVLSIDDQKQEFKCNIAIVHAYVHSYAAFHLMCCAVLKGGFKRGGFSTRICIVR